MNEAQIQAIKETLILIKSASNTIDGCCTSELAPNDLEAIRANEFGSYPDWLPRDISKSFGELPLRKRKGFPEIKN